MSSERSAAGVGVILISGKDPSAVSRLVSEAQAELLEEQDASMTVTRFSSAEYNSPESDTSIYPLTEACVTPPMFSPFRVIVARDLAVFNSAEIQPLLDYLEKPLTSTKLLLVWEKPAGGSGGRLPATLTKVVKQAGGVHRSADVGMGKEGEAWLREQCATAQVKLDAAAVGILLERLGEDRQRVRGILEVLRDAYGEGSSLSATDVAPYIGAPGALPPWSLTDAIGKGDIGKAVEQLQRFLGSGGRHPLQLMALLHNHFDRIVRLDGSGVRNTAGAAEVLRGSGSMPKSGSTYPASIALRQSRELGSAKIRRIVELLAAADLDLRGASGINPETVLEILVARLAAQHRSRPAQRR